MSIAFVLQCCAELARECQCSCQRGSSLSTDSSYILLCTYVHCHETYQRRVKYSACLRNDAYFEADRSCKGSRAWCLIIVKHVPNMKKWRVTTRVAYGHNMPRDNT